MEKKITERLTAKGVKVESVNNNNGINRNIRLAEKIYGLVIK